MAAKDKEYQSLRGTGTRGFGVLTASRGRLWLGKDHLLSTRAQWWVEEYMRFYFRDIQAFIIHKTTVGKIINIIFGALTILPLAAALATSDGMSVFWWITTGVFGAILLINTFNGPTCRCHIRTAVQTEELPSLRRLRRANKIFARLRPLITAAQGELPIGEIAARMEQLARPAVAATLAAVPENATSIAEPTAEPSAIAPPIV